MPENAETADGIVESLPNRPLEYAEAGALQAQSKGYFTMTLLELTADDWDGVAALSFFVAETNTNHLLGCSPEKGCWEVIASMEVDENEKWADRQERLVKEWAEDALAEFDGEHEFMAPADQPML